MKERIQKIIAEHGGISRRAAEKQIADGNVTVNGCPAVLGDKADPTIDEVCLNGIPLDVSKSRKLYIMLNKPVGYITTMRDELNRKTVAELVSDVPERVYPVGRLDINTSGLLLMTNDGEFANHICHPSFEKQKKYRAFVTGDIEQGMERLREPMTLDGVLLQKPLLRLARRGDVSVLDITIHEGRNHQIRRMCESAGLKVRGLVRLSVGGVRLGNLPKGKWRYLTENEVSLLRR